MEAPGNEPLSSRKRRWGVFIDGPIFSGWPLEGMKRDPADVGINRKDESRILGAPNIFRHSHSFQTLFEIRVCWELRLEICLEWQTRIIILITCVGLISYN